MRMDMFSVGSSRLEGTLIEPRRSVFEEIGEKVVEALKQEEHFSEDSIRQIARLFKSGEISNRDKVLELLQGESIENS